MKFEQVNYLMDYIMPRCKNPSAFKVISLIARETWGRKGAEWADISYNELLEKTSIKSVNTLKAAIADASEFIEQRPKENQGFLYRMKTISNSAIAIIDTVSEIDTEPYQKLIGTVSEIDTVLGEDSYKEEIEINNNTPPTPPESYLRFCPDWIATEPFLESWAEWVDYQSVRGKPLTAGSAKRQLQDMGKWGVTRSIAAIDYSIKQGYTGLIEPKTNGHYPQTKPPAPSQGLVEVEPGVY